MEIREAQRFIDLVYGVRDRARGFDKTFAWLVSEVGELAEAMLKNRGEKSVHEEAADILAWLLSLCNVAGVDLEKAFMEKYGAGCPRCRRIPCGCPQT
jgi:NTP pyrophosphatase (non-canonical NTP hydrolase)